MTIRLPGILGVSFCLAVAAGCGGKRSPRRTVDPGPVTLVTPETGPSALQKKLAAMTPASPLAPPDRQQRLAEALDRFHEQNPVRRGYIAVDKPLYRPGETIWFRAFDLAAPTLAEPGAQRQALAQLISPKGAAVIEKGLVSQTGSLTNDFMIPGHVPGGEYTVRVTTQTGEVSERKVIVSTYQPPRIKKKLEFLRKAYGAGDKVAAALALSRATGEALAKTSATAIVNLDGAELARLPVETDDAGNAVVRFELPGSIARGDGLLTVLVNDGGVTESIQKRVPITLDKIKLSLFPEGGDLVAGVPGRIYFQAENAMDKPADIEGRVVDDRGELTALFRSHWNGLGRFELTPEPGRSYSIEITRPAGVSARYAVPEAKEGGCSMMAVDGSEPVRVAVFCTAAQQVTASAVVRGQRVAARTVAIEGGGAPAIIALPIDDKIGQGAVRVTLFDRELKPIAERLIYRRRGADLDIEIEADAESYNPRDRVGLTIRATAGGEPVEGADLALAVVDDTVLSFADDKTATLLAEVYVESEMPGQEIEEPNFLFSEDPRAPAALDLVLGTKGWRRFDWKQVFPEPPPIRAAWDFTGDFLRGKLGLGRRVRGAEQEGDAKPAEPAEVADDDEMVARRLPPMKKAEAAKPVAARELRADAPAPPPRPEPMAGAAMADEELLVEAEVARDFRRPMRHRFQIGQGGLVAGKRRIDIIDKDWDGDKNAGWGWAPVRQFPVPSYPESYDGPRTDFRETVFWAPQIKTGADGVAKVSFTLSDAVTSFRAIAEGAGAGRLGRGEALVQSKLPVSLAVKMPMEVSKGDRVSLPVTVANETAERYVAELRAELGAAFKRRGAPLPEKLELAPGQRRSFFYDLEVVGDGAEPADGKALVSVVAAGLRDQVERTIRVVPRGFPIEISEAGTLAAGQKARHRIAIGDIVGDRMTARLTLYPSPLSTMTEGLEAVIREPVGCFEQASSANYPNVMVLAYMEDSDAKQEIDPALIERTHGMLDRGYKKLTGYESPSKGYEWFGGDPGHEALTAYGLMEFVDMTKVYGDVDRQMIERTAAWLKRRRDGKGGYKRDAKALDSFGRASPEVTDAYITYALTEAKQKGIDKEVARQKKMAETSSDPYVLALATNTLLNRDPKSAAAQKAARRLAAMQGEGGSFPGADHSITRSGGVALEIETTSLAVLALIKAGDAYREKVRRAIDWINENRDGFGGYGSTQSTVLALKALSAYSLASRRTRAAGVATVWVNGEQVGSVSYEKGHQGTLEIDLGRALRPGENLVEIGLESTEPIPYSFLAEYRSAVPASSDQTAVAIETSLGKSRVPMGEGATLGVTVRNKRSEGIPMALARVGIPGGMVFQTWQLKELVDKKLIDFYETREREVVLYFRSMAPGAVKKINLELLAAVPGRYVAPASRAYLYYTDEHKRWVDPVSVEITR